MKGYNKMRRKKQKRSDWAIAGNGVKVLNGDVELALKRFKMFAISQPSLCTFESWCGLA